MYKDELNKGFLIRICYIKLMIIICPSCKKKFEISENLIPKKGRLLKCGSCGETWFFNKNEQNDLEYSSIQLETENIIEENLKPLKKNEQNFKQNKIDFNKKKGTELVKYRSKSNFKIGKFFRYLVVLIITFVAVIIILDTFKGPLSIYFPNLELVLYNLFETLRDLILFAKDLR